MPWYKFTCDHGPGHQSHGKKYEWYDEAPSKEDEDEYWRHWVVLEQWHDCIGDVELVKHLPDDVRARKIAQYNRQISNAKKMLERLDEKESQRT